MLTSAPTVIKVGGELLESQLDELSRSIVTTDGPVVLVHGGGTQATSLANRLGIPQSKVGGRRVTSPETLEVAKMVYRGTLNTNIVASLRAAGISAVGLSGVDGQLISATKRPPRIINGETIDFGEVGDIEAVDPQVLHALLGAGYVPVVSCLGADCSGRVLNINADTLASSLAAALGAARLVCVTTAPGILRDPPHARSVIRQIDDREIETLCNEGVISDGMLPKVEACLRALRLGVGVAYIVDGRSDWDLLGSCGTQIALAQ